jgi:hypothetical protein
MLGVDPGADYPTVAPADMVAHRAYWFPTKMDGQRAARAYTRRTGWACRVEVLPGVPGAFSVPSQDPPKQRKRKQ